MPDALLVTCSSHTRPLVPPAGAAPGSLTCPVPGCLTAITVTALPASPVLTPLEQSSVARHEAVKAHERAGFSRGEAMQILCAAVQASIMKGGDGD